MRTGTIRGVGGDIVLSKLVLGTTYLHSVRNKTLSLQLLDEYFRLGGRTVDTARMYGQEGTERVSGAETLVGQWINAHGCREDITLITKGGHPALEDRGRGRLSADCVTRDIEDSLTNLGVDTVDLYLLHRDEPSRPVADIMDTLHTFVQKGYTRAIGASNWTLARIREANAYARAFGKTPFSVSQIQWCLATSGPVQWNDDTLVFMDRETHTGYLTDGLPVMAFSSQGKGYFSQYLSGGEAALHEKAKRFDSPANRRRAEAVRRLCARYSISPAAACLGYITCNPVEGFAIIAASSLAQLRDSMTAADLVLDAGAVKGLMDG